MHFHANIHALSHCLLARLPPLAREAALLQSIGGGVAHRNDPPKNSHTSRTISQSKTHRQALRVALHGRKISIGKPYAFRTVPWKEGRKVDGFIGGHFRTAGAEGFHKLYRTQTVRR